MLGNTPPKNEGSIIRARDGRCTKGEDDRMLENTYQTRKENPRITGDSHDTKEEKAWYIRKYSPGEWRKSDNDKRESSYKKKEY